MPTWTEELQEEKKPEGPWDRVLSARGPGVSLLPASHRPRASRGPGAADEGSCFCKRNNYSHGWSAALISSLTDLERETPERLTCFQVSGLYSRKTQEYL